VGIGSVGFSCSPTSTGQIYAATCVLKRKRRKLVNDHGDWCIRVGVE